MTDAPRFTRRHALAAGALASGVGLGATVVRVGSWWKKDTGPGLQILAPEEAELVDAVAEALFPAGGTPELSGADAGVSAWLDAHFVHLPDDTASQLRLLMNALDDWARLTQGARWAELPVERRSAKLESWMRRHLGPRDLRVHGLLPAPRGQGRLRLAVAVRDGEVMRLRTVSTDGLPAVRGHAEAPVEYDVDAVIVGAGPGGSAVAPVLSEAGWTVVVAEDGPTASNFRPNYAHTARYHMQEGGTVLAHGPVPLPVAAGRGVGGGSLVNSAICFRTPDPVLDEWAEMLDDERYRPDPMRLRFDWMEERIQVVPVTEDIAGENNMIVARGVAKLGLQGGLLRRNTPGCIGCGICNFGCPSGGKYSVDRNLLYDARRAGCVVQADCRAVAVTRENGRATGIVGQLHDPDTNEPTGMVRFRAKRAVVLSAGALGTPRLLWYDGLAEALGPVGGRLHLHPGTGVVGKCDHKVHMWKGATQGAYVWDPENPDVLPHTFNAPPEAFMAMSGKVGHAAKELLQEINYLCGLGVMVHDHGHGSVKATKSGRAKISYRWADRDVDTLKKGMVLSGRVLLAGGAREVFATAHGGARHTTAESFERELADMPLHAMQLYSAHPMSTCWMGTDKESSVVNSRGRMHRMAGLYVADAGVFPTSLGVNPQLSTMVISTLIGESILEDEA